MFLLLSYLIYLGISAPSYSDGVLTITEMGTISSSDVSSYSDATELIITFNNNIDIRSAAFKDFKSLKTISIQCPLTLTIQQDTFSGCTAIETLNFDVHSFTIPLGAFAGSTSLTVNYKGTGFKSEMTSFISSKIKAFNINVTGQCQFGLESAANSYIENIRIIASTIIFVQDCFKNAQGIELLSLYADDTIDFGINTFSNSQIKEIQCYAENSISLGQNCFEKVSNIMLVNLTSNGSLQLKIGCFESAQIVDVNLKAVQSIETVQDSFKNVTNFDKLTIETGTFEAEYGAFLNSYVQEIFIKTSQTTTFVQHSFKNTPNLRNLTVISSGNIDFQDECFIDSNVNNIELYTNGTVRFVQHSFKNTQNLTNLTIYSKGEIDFQNECFINSTVNTMELYTNGTVTFIQDAFKNTRNLTYFEIHSIGNIEFKTLAFQNSNVNVIDLYTNGQVIFGYQAFLNCANLTTLTIHSPSDVTFGIESFLNSQIEELNVTWENGTNGVIYLSTPSTITFESDSFKNCNELTKVNVVNDDGIVDIKSNSFQDSKSLVKLNVKSNKATIASGAFAGCSSLTDKTIDADDKNVAPDAFDGGDDDDDGKKKGGSSSHKDSDDDHSSAKTLGNIEIKTVYLGTSPNIFLNLNFMLSFFRKVRKTFGHVVPSPDLVHSAIWVSKDGSVSDSSVGAIFVYGRYFNKKNSPVYLDKDGAKAYVMTLKQFKQRYPAFEPMKLNPHKNVKLFEFIDKILHEGKWGVHDYNWPTNNCQHFTAKLINILGATRDTPTNDDWIELPKQVLNSLESNEKKVN